MNGVNSNAKPFAKIKTIKPANEPTKENCKEIYGNPAEKILQKDDAVLRWPGECAMMTADKIY